VEGAVRLYPENGGWGAAETARRERKVEEAKRIVQEDMERRTPWWGKENPVGGKLFLALCVVGY